MSGQAATSQEERSEALPNGTLLLGDQFTITRKLGNGGFGITYLAKDNYLDRSVVIKECFPEVFCHRAGKSVLVRSTANHDKYRSLVDMFMREARSIAKLRHPNIIGVHRVFEDNDTAYMALDLIDGRDLLDIITHDEGTLTPQQIQDALMKILDAVDLVHQQDLLHRDISPDNILLDKWGSPVLIDFGAAREEASRETRALSAVLVVKDGYSPQEFYFAGGKQTPCSDLYALAATFYHVISGEVPPNSQTRMAEVASDGRDPCVPLAGRFDHDYPPAFLAAIDKAMRVLPKERLQTVSEWLDMLNGREQVDGPATETAAPALLLKPNKALQKTLTRLVSETNEFVRQSAPVEEKPKPAQVAAVDAKKVPDWVQEFNEETLNPQSAPGEVQDPKRAPLRDTFKLGQSRLVDDSGGFDFGIKTRVVDPDAQVKSKSAEADSPAAAADDIRPMPRGLRTKLRKRMSKIRASWIAILTAAIIVQNERGAIAEVAQQLLQ